MTVLGVDIGGANLKLATASGYSRTIPFAVWREPDRLPEVLAESLRNAVPCERIAATTTAELADCYPTKREGIAQIYTALMQAADGRPVSVYLTDGRFVAPAEALCVPHLAAASNWHALARLAGRLAPSPDAMLIDMGSTTTDIIPLAGGEPVGQGTTDTERLLAGELVYLGLTRTPVAALVRTLPYRGAVCPVARELFATALDAHLWLGTVAEDRESRETADGRPATRARARERLARMVGADRESFDERDARRAARAIDRAQRRIFARGLEQVWHARGRRPATYVLAGQGERLLTRWLDELGVPGARLSLRERLDERVSEAAAAYAVAVLAAEVSSVPAVAANAS
ncbi:MAG: hypothetical protein JNG90_10470 [Planctomycetaceae bacterium]|nr:hypothetical protein [Planctomycetaceae bacterium]